MKNERVNPIWLPVSVITVLFLLVLSGAICSSCITTKRQTNKTYTTTWSVKVGEHSSTKSIDLIDNPLNGEFRLNESFWWAVPEKNGWSKLVGMGNESSGAKENNRLLWMRKDIKHDGVYKTVGLIGWGVCDDNYCEYNPKLITIDTVFEITRHKYRFELGYKGNDKAYLIFDGVYREQPVTHSHGIKYLNHLYIGGTYTVDRTVHLNIKFN